MPTIMRQHAGCMISSRYPEVIVAYPSVPTDSAMPITVSPFSQTS